MAMMLKPKSSNDGSVVPDGTYPATLTKVSQFDNAYGQRIGFEFTLSGKGVDGSKVMRSTSPILSSKGKLAEVLEGLMGRELSQAELTKGVDVEKLVGAECKVLVLQSKGKNGATYSNVERIFQQGSLL